MSSDEIKDQLVDWYGGNSSDWKRKSKKKKGSFDVRTFENKKLGLTKTIVSNEDEDYIYKPEYFPNGDFWIYVNKENFDISDIDETKSYYDEKAYQDMEEDGIVTFVLKSPCSNYWYDQHVSFIMEDYFGVKKFTEMFDEVQENCSILVKDIPLNELRNMFEKQGMKFLGYRNSFSEDI